MTHSYNEDIMDMEEQSNKGLSKINSIIFYRKLVIIITFLTVAPIVGYVGFKFPKKYKASTTILVIPQKISAAYVRASGAERLSERIRTITQEIMSRSRILKVMSKMGITKNLEDQNAIEKKVTEVRELIKLEVSHGSSFQISCTGGDAKFLTDLANTTASIFIDESLKRNSQQVRNTTQFLEDELLSMRKKLEGQEEIVSNFKSRYMGELPQQQEAILSSLNRIQLQFQAGEKHILEIERQKKMLLDLKAHEIRLESERRKSIKSRLPYTANISEAISPLHIKLLELKQRLKQLKTRYSDAWPEIVRVKKKIFDAEVAFKKEEIAKNTAKGTEKGSNLQGKQEVASISSHSVRRIEANLKDVLFNINEQKETQTKLKDKYEVFQKRLENIPNRGIELAKISRDYEIIKANYQSLLRKKMDAQLSENLVTRQQGERFSILDFATIPTTPYFPTMKMILGGSLGGGLALAFLLAFLFDFIDDSFKNVNDLKEWLKLPVLAVIPRIAERDFLSVESKGKAGKEKTKLQRKSKLISYLKNDSYIREEYKNFRALLLNKLKSKGCNVIAVSSATSGEGKTLTASNLAITISQGIHESVLLVDGDMKKPSIHKLFGIEKCPGLSNYLEGNAETKDLFKKTGFDKLSVITSGNEVMQSSELINSDRMRGLISEIKSRYENRYIIIDLPPILPLSDVLSISDNIDGLVLVVSAGGISKPLVESAIQKCQAKNIIGIVFNNYKGMALEAPQMYKTYYKGSKAISTS